MFPLTCRKKNQGKSFNFFSLILIVLYTCQLTLVWYCQCDVSPVNDSDSDSELFEISKSKIARYDPKVTSFCLYFSRNDFTTTFRSEIF